MHALSICIFFSNNLGDDIMAASTIAPGVFFAIYAFLGFGLPIGIPPLPEDAPLTRIAPEDCLLYFNSFGMAKPDGKSDNLTEQFFANDEIQQFAASVEKAARDALDKKLPPGQTPITSDELITVAKTVLTRPWAVYVGMVSPPLGPSQGPYVQAGFVVNLGEGRDRFEAILQKLIPMLPVAQEESDGQTWYSFAAIPNLPMKFGFHKNYFLFASGREEMSNMVKRMEGGPAEWLVALKEKLPVERRATFGFVNVQKIRTLYVPLADLAAGGRVGTIIETLGLNNVPAVVLTTGLEKKGFVNKTMVCVEGEPKGFLAPSADKGVKLDDLKQIPADASFASVGDSNLAGFYDLIFNIVQKVDGSQYADMQKSISEAEDMLGLKIRDDILGSFGDRFSLYDSPSGGGALIGTTIILHIKDREKAEKVVQTLHRLLNAFFAAEAAKNANRFPPTLPTQVETLKFNGNSFHTLNVGEHGFPFAPSWCLTQSELIIGLSPQTVKAALMRSDLKQTLADVPGIKQAIQASDKIDSFSYQNANRGFDVAYIYLTLGAKILSTEMRYAGIEWNPANLPTANAFKPYLLPCISMMYRTKHGLVYEIQQSVPGTAIIGSASSVGPVAVALLLPAVQAARTAARRAQSSNNLKQIGLALHTYHDANRRFPAAYSADKNGKPLLSWRVHILPFMESNSLYKEFHLDEPWDSEHNKKFIAQMPQELGSPFSAVAGEGKTTYLGVRGKHAFFIGTPGIRMGDVQDGLSRTIMVVEVDDKHAVEWTKPDDWEYDENNPKEGLTGVMPTVFNALFADGSVRSIPLSIGNEALKALFTRDGEEPIYIPEF